MAQNARTWLDAPIINLDTTDSTNNDAMRLIDADKALPGTTIVTRFQESGKGQRGNTWTARAGECLMMSVIVVPTYAIDQQFIFSALVATSIAAVLQKEDPDIKVQIKWPNDIILNDKKAGGILIENVLRGQSWLYAVIGIGFNVLQRSFDDSLPNATSLKIASGGFFSIQDLMHKIRSAVIEKITTQDAPETIIDNYNRLLFKKDQSQSFKTDTHLWSAMINGVGADGKLELTHEDGSISHHIHGSVQWMY